MIATAICAVVVAAGVFSWNLRGAEMTSLVLIAIAATCLVSLRTFVLDRLVHGEGSTNVSPQRLEGARGLV